MAQNVTLIDAVSQHVVVALTSLGAGWGPGSLLTTPGCPGDACDVRNEECQIAAGAAATIIMRARVK